MFARTWKIKKGGPPVSSSSAHSHPRCPDVSFHIGTSCPRPAFSACRGSLQRNETHHSQPRLAATRRAALRHSERARSRKVNYPVSPRRATSHKRTRWRTRELAHPDRGTHARQYCTPLCLSPITTTYFIRQRIFADQHGCAARLRLDDLQVCASGCTSRRLLPTLMMELASRLRAV